VSLCALEFVVVLFLRKFQFLSRRKKKWEEEGKRRRRQEDGESSKKNTLKRMPNAFEMRKVRDMRK
jgi:hypothetical protein